MSAIAPENARQRMFGSVPTTTTRSDFSDA